MEDTNSDTEKTVLDCPCGERIAGADQDDLLRRVRTHLAERHPDHDYTDEQILFIAF